MGANKTICIPVGSPTLYHTGVSVKGVSGEGWGVYLGVSVQGGLCPGGLCPGISFRTETFQKEHATRDRDPPEGTWDRAARQEVTSYRNPLPPVGQNDRCG